MSRPPLAFGVVARARGEPALHTHVKCRGIGRQHHGESVGETIGGDGSEHLWLLRMGGGGRGDAPPQKSNKAEPPKQRRANERHGPLDGRMSPRV